MLLERRRLCLALTSTLTYLAGRIILEVAQSQGYLSKHLLDAQPMLRGVAGLVPIVMIAIIVRNLRRGQSDWPVERLMVVLGTIITPGTIVVPARWSAIVSVAGGGQACLRFIWRNGDGNLAPRWR